MLVVKCDAVYWHKWVPDAKHGRGVAVVKILYMRLVSEVLGESFKIFANWKLVYMCDDGEAFDVRQDRFKDIHSSVVHSRHEAVVHELAIAGLTIINSSMVVLYTCQSGQQCKQIMVWCEVGYMVELVYDGFDSLRGLRVCR
jgi:hypothetical protein